MRTKDLYQIYLELIQETLEECFDYKPRVLKMDVRSEQLDYPNVGGIATAIKDQCESIHCLGCCIKGVNAAKKKVGSWVKVRKAEPTHTKFNSASFDLIIDFNYINELENLVHLLREYKRLLSPNGKLLLITHRDDITPYVKHTNFSTEKFDDYIDLFRYVIVPTKE